LRLEREALTPEMITAIGVREPVGGLRDGTRHIRPVELCLAGVTP